MDLIRPADSLEPGQVPGPRCQVSGGREPAHVATGLGDDHVSHQGGDPGDGDEQVPHVTKGLHHHLDPTSQLVDGPGVVVDQVQMELSQEPVVLAEPAGEGLGEFGDLGPHAAFGQISQHYRVTLALDQGFEHGPPRNPGDVGGDRRQFDAGVFQQLLQPLDLLGPGPHEGGAGAGQVPELTDRFRWDERAPDQPVGPQLGQPCCVRDIGLPTRQVLDVSGVDQHHLEGTILE